MCPIERTMHVSMPDAFCPVGANGIEFISSWTVAGVAVAVRALVVVAIYLCDPFCRSNLNGEMV